MAPRRTVSRTGKASFAWAALALCMCGVAARADNADGAPRQPDASTQRTAQTLPPARVILPAPWEQATPAQPAVVPATSSERK